MTVETGHNHETTNPVVILHSRQPLGEDNPAHTFGPFPNEHVARAWEEAVDHPDDCAKVILDLFIDRGSTLIDTKALARAIRFVERTRADAQGEVFEGPDVRWYDSYAEDIGMQYDLLMAEAKP